MNGHILQAEGMNEQRVKNYSKKASVPGTEVNKVLVGSAHSHTSYQPLDLLNGIKEKILLLYFSLVDLDDKLISFFCFGFIFY